MPKRRYKLDRELPSKLFSSEDDMEWLRMSLLFNLPRKYKSARVYGNDEFPMRIDVFEVTEPDESDEPVVYDAVDGKYVKRS